MTCQPSTRSICLAWMLAWMLSIGLLAEEDTRPPVQLIAPIFPQIDGLESSLYFAIVSDNEYRDEGPDGVHIPGSDFSVIEHQETWGVPWGGCGTGYRPDSNLFRVHTQSLDWAVGTCVENGWVSVRFPGDGEVHAYVKTWHEDRPDDPFLTQAVRPAAAFRLISEGQPTGIAIVNPTEESQEVTIRFYQSGIPPLDIRESVLTIPRQSKVSRYLSDLVDLEGLEDTSTPLRKHNAGVVRIQGETEIAVAAAPFLVTVRPSRGGAVGAAFSSQRSVPVRLLAGLSHPSRRQDLPRTG